MLKGVVPKGAVTHLEKLGGFDTNSGGAYQSLRQVLFFDFGDALFKIHTLRLQRDFLRHSRKDRARGGCRNRGY